MSSLRSTSTATVALLLAMASAGCKGAPPPTISGHVEATEVRIATKVGGRLVAFAAQEGDRVENGATLAQLEIIDAELALGTALAERDAASADLALKRAGFRREDVAEARAIRRQLEADLAGAERDLTRFQQLLDSGSGTGKARDDAETRRNVLRERLAAAEQTVRRLESGFRPEEIAAATARVAAADARIAQLRQQAADATIVVPRSGVVTEKVVEAGELLAPGSTLAVVTDLADVWLNVYVGGDQLPGLRLGQEVEVRTDTGLARRGRISFIAAQAEFTPKNAQTRDERVKLVYRVKIALPNDDGLFKPGMPAEALLEAATAAPAGAVR